MRLRREAPDPLYVQLKEALVAGMRSGQYPAHQRLPSERELSEHYQVSRMTARQALVDLVRDGLIYTRAGKGTFVAEPKIDQQLRTVTGFSQDMRTRGARPANLVLEAKLIVAPAEVAAALRLPPNAEVILLARVRLADDVPLAVETAYLPAALCPNLLRHDFAHESLYQVLEAEYGFRLSHAEQTIEARLASPREVELLALAPTAAVLRLERLTVRHDGVPVEYVTSAYRGDRYKLHTTLNPSGAQPTLTAHTRRTPMP
jgi:GntR family transcriptional regulator